MIFSGRSSRQKHSKIVTIGDEQLLEKDRINAFLSNLMYKAIDQFRNLTKLALQNKIDKYQTEELQRFLQKKKLEARSKNANLSDFDAQCVKCSHFLCNVSDIRCLLNKQNFVIDPSYSEKIIIEDKQKMLKYDGLTKNKKMFCKKCRNYVGAIAEDKYGYKLYLLKIGNLKFFHKCNERSFTYKGWPETPFDIEMVEIAKVPDLLAFQKQPGQ